MTREKNNGWISVEKLKNITEWFALVKAPDLEEKINEAVGKVESGEPLEDKQRKLLGFILFSYSMNHGPATFLMAEEIANEINVLDEMKFYANDWINHSKQKEAAT